MSFATALVLIAQSAAPAAAIAPDTAAVRGQVAERVSATVQVLRPERISAVLEQDADELANASAQRIQRSLDEAGTVWIEFS